MFKANDPISITRPSFTQKARPRDYIGDGAWYLVRDKKDKTIKGVVADLSHFFIPLTLSDKHIRNCLYEDLTFLTGDRASYASKKPDRHKIVNCVEKNVIGKAIRIIGKMFLADVNIPILINGGELLEVPYRELTFVKKEKK